ncbi:MAG: HAMP domain-containing protein [Bacteroidota bacterium]|nr:HAMP domain-containing protein [Bacteroidota bacterium]
MLLPVILAILGYSYFNYNTNKERLIETEHAKRKIIAEQIKMSLLMFDASAKMLEHSLDKEMIKMSNSIINLYNQDTSLFLKSTAEDIAKKAGLNTKINDLYIFNSQNIIFKTTFAKDLGFDFNKLGVRYIHFLDSIKNLGKCFPERTSIQFNTNKPKKFSYHSTKDKKYVLELSYSSPDNEMLQNTMFNSIDEIRKQYKEFKKITLYMATEIFPTYDKNALLKESHKPEMLKLDKTGRELEFIENENGSKITYFYYFIDMKGSYMHDGWIIQFISDDRNEMALVKRELTNLLWLLALTVLPLCLIIYFGTKRLTTPIKILAQKVKRISSGNLTERVDVKGNNEITELSIHFNKMVNDLEESYNTLEEKVKTRTQELANEKKHVEEKQKEILDSIHYAKRIQNALLPNGKYIERKLKDLMKK